MSKPKHNVPSHNAPPLVETDEDRLDEALDETFPASDPIAVDPIEHAHHPGKPHAPAKDKKHD
jgi:hypothetical protein